MLLMKIIRKIKMNLTEINLREKKFHDKLQSKSHGRKENIFYKALSSMFKDFEKYLEEHTENKIVLDYGCGVGSITQRVALFKPLKITGIDISKISIEKAKLKAKELNLNITYYEDNCENCSLKSNEFDVIYGSGILHHLNIEKSVTEINRLLKNKGKMIFMEPLGTNPLINFYRKLTPNSRSDDEHPFIKKDFDFLKEEYADVNIRYYGFLTLIFFLFYKDPNNSVLFNFLDKIDKTLFKVKFFRIFAWAVLIVCNKS